MCKLSQESNLERFTSSKSKNKKNENNFEKKNFNSKEI